MWKDQGNRTTWAKEAFNVRSKWLTEFLHCLIDATKRTKPSKSLRPFQAPAAGNMLFYKPPSCTCDFKKTFKEEAVTSIFLQWMVNFRLQGSFSTIRSFRTSASSIAKDVIFSSAASPGVFSGKVTKYHQISNNWKIHSDPWSILLLWMRLCHPRYQQGILQPPSSTPLLWDLRGQINSSPKSIQKLYKFHPKIIPTKSFKMASLHLPTLFWDAAVSYRFLHKKTSKKTPSNATNSALLHGPLPLCPVPPKQLIPARQLFPRSIGVVGNQQIIAENPST